MEEQNEVISRFLAERGLDEDGISKRQKRDLEHIFRIVSEMNAAAAANAVSVKTVAQRTQEGRLGHSISLATFYNNGKILYDFVEFLKPGTDPGVADELKACRAENAELKKINAALIRRDVKFEEMQAEIDSLRNELKLMRDFREANAASNHEERVKSSQDSLTSPTFLHINRNKS